MIDLQEHGIELDNGVERNREAPDTFEIPCAYERCNIGVGEYAKLMFINKNNEGDLWAERMWVKITKVTDEGYIGTLANDPLSLTSLTFGTDISFGADNVIDITK